MKAAKIILIIIATAVVVNFIRGGQNFSLPRVLPFCSGNPPSFWYDVVGGCGLLVLLIYGLSRLKQTNETSKPPGDSQDAEDNYEYEPEGEPAWTENYDAEQEDEE